MTAQGAALALPASSLWRRAATALAALMAVAGVGLLAYPFLTDLSQASLEHRLADQLASPAIRNDWQRGTVPVGASLTRIRIPAIGVNVIVVQGTTEQALAAGAGHYPDTPLPCTLGNVAIAGHRTTYGKPFANLDRLRPGDEIFLDTPLGSCAYRVSRPPFAVLPDDLAVVANTPRRATLTLTTCTPRGFATHRLVVKAVLVGRPLSL
jgi:sortase A